MVNSSKSILFVEDEVPHQLVITKALQDYFHFDVVGSYNEALQFLGTKDYDLFLLDVMLGDGLGFDLVAEIRSQKRYAKAPIVFLTSRDDIDSKIKGFSLGADDYLVKPCDPRELRARMDSKIEKADSSQPAGSEFYVDRLVFSFENQAAFIIQGDERKQLDLTPIEYKLLYFFARHLGDTLSRERILDKVWGTDTHVMVRSVDTYVAALRKKVKEFGVQIKSVHGVGYRIQFLEPIKKAS